jgi:voltage-dependent potassium channel beta subunit
MDMDYRRLGKSGLQVSALSLGSWVTFGSQVENRMAEDLMKLAYDKGVNFFDNAEGYAAGKSEEVMGTILRKMGWSRDTFLVSSKVFWGGDKPNQTGLCRKHVFEACHAALKRLQVDYLDMYFCHRPDPNTPIWETVRTMNTLIEQGKILYWGTSEWSAREIQEAIGIAESHHLIPPTMEQPYYNLLGRDRLDKELAPLFESRNGLGTTIFSPLAGGLLTGKYNEGIPEDSRYGQKSLQWLKEMMFADWETSLRRIKALGKIADELGVPMARMSLAWCLTNPNVSTVIMGASREAQLEENLKSLEVLPKLTPEVLEAIDKATA